MTCCKKMSLIGAVKRRAPEARASFGFALLLLVLAGLGLAGPAMAQDKGPAKTSTDGAPAATAASAPSGKIGIQLNKLEPHGQACRAYLVIRNKTAASYPTFKVDLIEFRTDGIIGHRFLFDLGPIPANKTEVRLYDIDTPCDQIGSFLFNDVTDCETASGPAKDCLDALNLTSLAKAELSK